MSLSKKTALVIGASGGIGGAVTKLLLDKGIKTYATFHTRTITPQGNLSADCRYLRCDTSNDRDIDELFKELHNEARIDFYVNCSSPALKLKPFDSLSVTEITEDLNVHLLGNVKLTKRLIPLMKKSRSGVLVFLLTAALADFPSCRLSSYLIAKSALLGLLRSIAPELLPFGIHTFGISPTFVDTELITAFPSPLIEIEKSKQLDGNFLKPEEIAQLILSIFENPKQYKNGQNILVKSTADLNQLLISRDK